MAMEESGGKFPPLLDYLVDAIQMRNRKEKMKEKKDKRKIKEEKMKEK